MNETLLYLKRYFYPTSQPRNVDTFSELLSLLLHQDEMQNETTTKPIKFPHGFVGNQGYDLFLQLITSLHPGCFMGNLEILNKIKKTLTECDNDLLVHQSSSKNQSLDIVIGAKNLQGEVLGFQTILEHQKNKWIYSFTWNRPRQSGLLSIDHWDLEGHIFCIPSTVTVKRGFLLNNQKKIEVKPFPDACFDANASYFLFSLSKKNTATNAVLLTYSKNQTEQQFEFYDFLNPAYIVQTQPRALHHIDRPQFYSTMPRQKWNKNPHPTLYITQTYQTPGLSEPSHSATTLDHPLKIPVLFHTLIIQDSLHEIHQHPLPPIWISITKNYSNTIPKNSFFPSELPNQYCGNNIKVTYNPHDLQAQRISFSFGFFNKNKLLIGTRFTYQLTSGQYSVSQEHGLFNCETIIYTQETLSPIRITGSQQIGNELICGKITQYSPNRSAREPALETMNSLNTVVENMFLIQINTIFHDIFNTVCPHDILKSHEETSIGTLDNRQQEELNQLSRFFRSEMDALFKETVRHQIARIHHCLDLTKKITSLRTSEIEHLSLFDKPSKAQIKSEHQEAILREWRTLSHLILEKIQTEEHRAWQSLIKKQIQIYLTLNTERFLKEKSVLAERILHTHEWIQGLYGTFFQQTMRLFQFVVFQKEQAFLVSNLLGSYSAHIAIPQHQERKLLYSQFAQKTQDLFNRQFEILICTERLQRRFLMFSLANEYATEVIHYHQKQASLELCKFAIHGERIGKQVNQYLEHMTTKFPLNNHQSIVDVLQMAYNAGLIGDAILTGSAARGSVLANDIDLKIFVKNDTTSHGHQRLLKILSDLILASTKRYVRADNALLTLEFMGPKGLPFNLVIFFLDNKKTEYPPLYQEDIIVRFNFTKASWQFFHEVVNYPDHSDKKLFSLRCQAISEPAKLAEVLSTQSFNMKRFDEPGAVLRVIRDIAYFPTKAIYNEKKLTNIWQHYKNLQKENMANMIVLFLNGDVEKNIPPKIHSHQQARFKSLVDTYFPNWERHCGHQARPNATTTFFHNNATYFGIAGVIDKIGNASSKIALQQILSDIDTLGIDDAVQHWKRGSPQASKLSLMHP